MELVVHVASECADLPEAALCRDRLNFSSWGKGLSLEQYLERERQQWRLPFSRNGLRLWELRNRDETLASLETYAVPVAGGGIAGVGHGIASVFVEERLRGAGHASALVRRVNERLKDEGALLTYLMSEIGAPLYERLGYRGRPLRLRRFAPSDPQQPDLSPDDPRVQPLSEANIADLLKERYQPHRHHQHHRAPLSLFVTPEQIGWHLDRGRFYARVRDPSTGPSTGQPPERAPAHAGARAGDAFALWTADYRHDALRVLMLYPGARLYAAGLIDNPRSPEAAAVRDVMHAARDEAGRLGLSAVEIWENAENPGWLRGGLPLPAADLPMLLPLSPGISADDWLDFEYAHWL